MAGETGLSTRRELLVRGLLGAAAAGGLTGFTTAEALFAPDAELWPRWQAHDPESRETVDVAIWDGLLRRYLRRGAEGVALFDYGAVTAADRQALDAFVDRLAATTVGRLDRDEQLAYWINLYNVLTVRVVLDHYPVDSIRDIDISPGLFADGPWDKALVAVEGEALTLNDIEHRIVRPIWRDPRIHYAVNCASIGCPDLADRAFRGTDIETSLEAAARAYVNSPRGLSIARGRVTVSKIYDWFHEDFGYTEEAVLAHLQRYAEPDLAARLAALGRIDDTAYDWSLNDAARAE